MKFTAFVKKYLGKKIDFDGVYGVQCVDLIDQYIRDVLELSIGYYGNAKTWWTNRNKSEWLKSNFYFITPGYKPNEVKPGDIGVRTSGDYGHIFIIKAQNGNKLTIYDQNAGGSGEGMTERVIDYNSTKVNGILRPKNQSNIDTKLYGNATVTRGCDVFGDSRLDPLLKVGAVYKGDRVLKLGTGNGKPIVAYPVGKYYKVGFIPTGYIKED